jgi:hypothetical protein
MDVDRQRDRQACHMLPLHTNCSLTSLTSSCHIGHEDTQGEEGGGDQSPHTEVSTIKRENEMVVWWMKMGHTSLLLKFSNGLCPTLHISYMRAP